MHIRTAQESLMVSDAITCQSFPYTNLLTRIRVSGYV